MKRILAILMLLTCALALSLSVPVHATVPPGTLQPNDLLLNKSGVVSIYSSVDGHYKGDLVSAGFGTVGDSWGITIGPDGNLYLCDFFAGSIKRYNGTTGTFLDDFVPSGSAGLGGPVGLAFLPDGNLYVATNGSIIDGSTIIPIPPGYNPAFVVTDTQVSEIMRFNGLTGAPIDIPVPCTSLGTLDFADLYNPPVEFGYEFLGHAPQDIIFGSDGNLYVSTFGTNTILRYNPTIGITEEFLNNRPASQGSIRQFAFGPDGNLYVTSQEDGSIKRYSGVDGHYIDDFVSPGSGGLANVLGIAFGPDGNIYASSGSNNILRYNGTTGAFLGAFVANDSATYILFNKGVTLTGANVAITPVPTTSLTFSSITAPGQTVVTQLNSATASLPANFAVATATGGTPTYLHVQTTATFSGAVEFAISYDPAQFPYVAGTWTNGPPLLLHDPASAGAWNDNATNNWIAVHGASVTIDGNTIVNGVDPVNHKVYGRTTSLSPFAIVHRLAYAWSGVLDPINPDGSSIFKRGSTVPVKFKLTGADASITNLKARLYLSHSDSVDPATTNEGEEHDDEDSGFVLRYDANAHQYVYNLRTKEMDQGTWYLWIELGDGVNHVVKIKLKK